MIKCVKQMLGVNLQKLRAKEEQSFFTGLLSSFHLF